MKKYCVIGSMILFSILAIGCYAQNEILAFIPSSHLYVTYNKTTNLIFPYAVQSIDRGSKDILVQQPKGTENIVQLKADKPNFTQTNLSVITTNGKLYSFTIDYAAEPAELNIIIEKRDTMMNDLPFKQIVVLTSIKDESLFNTVAEKITETKERKIKRDKENHIELLLNGIYINQDVLYFRIKLKNKSNISYDVDAIRFTIKDSQQSKQTATQETEVKSIYTYEDFAGIQGKSSASCIIALPKFTLPDSKYLSVQLLEKSGGRNLDITLKNRHLMKAISVNELY